MSDRTGDALELPGAFRLPAEINFEPITPILHAHRRCGNPCAVALRCTFFDEAKWTACFAPVGTEANPAATRSRESSRLGANREKLAAPEKCRRPAAKAEPK